VFSSNDTSVQGKVDYLHFYGSPKSAYIAGTLAQNTEQPTIFSNGLKTTPVMLSKCDPLVNNNTFAPSPQPSDPQLTSCEQGFTLTSDGKSCFRNQSTCYTQGSSSAYRQLLGTTGKWGDCQATACHAPNTFGVSDYVLLQNGQCVYNQEKYPVICDDNHCKSKLIDSWIENNGTGDHYISYLVCEKGKTGPYQYTVDPNLPAVSTSVATLYTAENGGFDSLNEFCGLDKNDVIYPHIVNVPSADLCSSQTDPAKCRLYYNISVFGGSQDVMKIMLNGFRVR